MKPLKYTAKKMLATLTALVLFYGSISPAVIPLTNAATNQLVQNTTAPLKPTTQPAACYHDAVEGGTTYALRMYCNDLGCEDTLTGNYDSFGDMRDKDGNRLGADIVIPSTENAICKDVNGNTIGADDQPNDNPPGAPTNFTATNITERNLKLSWALPPAIDDVSKYHFEYSQNADFSGATFFSLSSTATGTTLELGNQAGKKYFFRMRAENSHGYSIYSETLTATMAGTLPTEAPATPPNQLSGVTTSNPTASSITLSWNPGDGTGTAAITYIVEYSKNADFSNLQTQRYSASETQVTINNLTPITNYYFRVIAENINGQSSASSVINMATLEDTTSVPTTFPTTAPTTFPTTVPTTAPTGEVCTTEWNPVCSTDGVTYSNMCSLNQSRMVWKHDGECKISGGTDGGFSDTELRDRERDIKNFQRDIKNKNRELDRDFEGVDIAKAKDLLNKAQEYLNMTQEALNRNHSGDFWDNWNKTNDQLQKINEVFQGFWAIRSYNDFEKHRLQETERQIKDLRKQIKDIKRDNKNIDATSVENKINTLEKNVKELRQKWKQINISAPDLQDQMNDLQWDADDVLNHNIWDDLNELWDIANKSRESEDMKRILKDYAKNGKDRERRIKELERDGVEEKDLKEFQKVHNTIQAIYQKMEKVLDELQNGKSRDNRDFWDLLDDYNNTQNEFWDLEQSLGIWDKREVENISREIKNNEQILDDMRRECGRVQCKEKAKSIIKELANYIQNMRDAIAVDDFGRAWDAHNEFHFYSRDFWDLNEGRRLQKDLGIQLKDLARRYEHEKQWTDDMKKHDNRPIVDDLRKMVSELKKIVDDANNFYQKQEYQEAQNVLEERLYRDWDRRWGDLTFQLNEGERRSRDNEDINYMREEFDRFEFNLRNAKDTNSDTIGICLEFLNKGRSIIDELEELFERDQIDEYAKQIDKRWEKLGSLGERAERLCGEFMNDFHRNTTVINDLFDEGAIQQRMEQMIANMTNEIVNKLVETMTRQMANIMTTMMESVGEIFEAQVEATLSAVTQVVPEALQESVMSAKQATLEKAKALEDLKSELGLNTSEQLKLDEAKNKLAGANLYGTAAGVIEQEIEDFVATASTMSPTAREKRLSSMLLTIDKSEETSRKLMKDDNVIPFYDTDLTQWFTPNVRSVSDAGIVQGKADTSGTFTGYYDPVASVTIAEFTKIAMETAGKKPQEGTPKNQDAREHWARGYVVAAEALGGSIADFYTSLDDLNRPAQRREVVFLLLAIKGINPADYSGDQFTDVKASDPYAPYIQAARAIGLTTGDTNADGTPTNTFGGERGMNRAEGAAFSDRFLKIDL